MAIEIAGFCQKMRITNGEHTTLHSCFHAALFIPGKFSVLNSRTYALTKI